jgi:hypothetical protein
MMVQDVEGIPGAVVPFSPGGKQIPPNQIMRRTETAPVTVPGLSLGGVMPPVQVPGAERLEPYFPKTEKAGAPTIREVDVIGADGVATKVPHYLKFDDEGNPYFEAVPIGKPGKGATAPKGTNAELDAGLDGLRPKR